MIDERIVKRIAKTYVEKYSTLGFAHASQYAQRIIGDDAVLQTAVRVEVERLLQGLSQGGNDGPSPTGPA